jgi:hypothetical protein
MCPVAARSRVPLSLSMQPTNYLQVPPHSEEATQAMRARQELQSRLGVHSTALLCTSAQLLVFSPPFFLGEGLSLSATQRSAPPKNPRTQPPRDPCARGARGALAGGGAYI